MNKILVTDGNYIIMRSYYIFKSLRAGDVPSGALYGYVKTFFRLYSTYRPDVYIPLFDNGRSAYRTSISKQYKSNRGKKPEDLLVQMRACREFIDIIGLKYYEEKNVEADDLAAKVAKDCSKDNFVMLYSKDHDWMQLLKDNVIMIRPQNDNAPAKVIDYDSCKDDMKWPPERWPEIAAIMGDPGDGVYGLKGYGWSRSLKLLNKYGNLWNAITNDNVLHSNAKQLLDNYSMTVLDGSVPSKDVPVNENAVCNINVAGNEDLRKFFERWNMKSLMEVIDNGI